MAKKKTSKSSADKPASSLKEALGFNNIFHNVNTCHESVGIEIISYSH